MHQQVKISESNILREEEDVLVKIWSWIRHYLAQLDHCGADAREC